VYVLGDPENPRFGFGYVPNNINVETCMTQARSTKQFTYHNRSTPKSTASRTRACLMSATPPPCGVLLKNAIFVFFVLSETTNFIIASQVDAPHVVL
jgi:hypothetical protein